MAKRYIVVQTPRSRLFDYANTEEYRFKFFALINAKMLNTSYFEAYIVDRKTYSCSSFI